MANIIHQHVVIFGALFGIVHQSFEYLNEVQFADLEAGFFPDLTAQSVVQPFAGFNCASRQRPISLQWFVPALD